MHSMIFKDYYLGEFCAGALASFLTVLVFQPFDVLHLSHTLAENGRKIEDTINIIYNGGNKYHKRRGIANFYHALPVSLLVSVITYALYFPLNTYCKNENPFELENRYALYIMANLPPSFLCITLVNPLWIIKYQQIAQFDTAKTIIYELHGYTHGLLLSYLTSVNGIITFTLYDVFKYALVGPHTILDYTLCALLSKAIALAISYPLMVLQRRQHSQQLSSCVAIQSIWKKHPKTLYDGLNTTLMRQLPKTIMTMVLYESLLQAF